MCLAAPGKVVKKMEDDLAIVDFNGIKKKVNISLVEVEADEYVMVHAGFAIEKLNTDEAKEVLDLFE